MMRRSSDRDRFKAYAIQLDDANEYLPTPDSQKTANLFSSFLPEHRELESLTDPIYKEN